MGCNAFALALLISVLLLIQLTSCSQENPSVIYKPAQIFDYFPFDWFNPNNTQNQPKTDNENNSERCEDQQEESIAFYLMTLLGNIAGEISVILICYIVCREICAEKKHVNHDHSIMNSEWSEIENIFIKANNDVIEVVKSQKENENEIKRGLDKAEQRINDAEEYSRQQMNDVEEKFQAIMEVLKLERDAKTRTISPFDYRLVQLLHDIEMLEKDMLTLKENINISPEHREKGALMRYSFSMSNSPVNKTAAIKRKIPSISEMLSVTNNSDEQTIP